MSRSERVPWTLDAVTHLIPPEVWERVEESRPAADEWVDAQS